MTEEAKLDLPALKLLANNLIRKYQKRIAALSNPENLFYPIDRVRVVEWVEFLGKSCLTDVIDLRGEHWNNKSQRPWEYEKLEQFEAGLIKNKRQVKPFLRTIRGVYSKAGMPIKEKWPEHLKQTPASR